MLLIFECSSRGNFTVPANLAVSAVYFLMQAPAGLEFQVPTPLSRIGNCGSALSSKPYRDLNVTWPTIVNGSFEAVFDSGAKIPSVPLTSELISGCRFFHMKGIRGDAGLL